MLPEGVSRIGVLDVNHGGLVIARKLRKLGYDAFAVDTYGTKNGIEADLPVYRADDTLRYDMLVSPVHLPRISLTEKAEKQGLPVITHHDAVGEIIKAAGTLKGIRCVEVTGTFGKTTACEMLFPMLERSGEKVLRLTSRGLYYGDEPLGKLSITPASLLVALDTVKERGLKPDVCIFEVSLGGCGVADIGAITTLEGDYAIAGGASMASAAKGQMAGLAKPGSMLVLNDDISIGAPVAVNTFGDKGNVRREGDTIIYDIRKPDGSTASGKFDSRLSGRFEIETYEKPSLCAAAIALTMGVLPADVAGAMGGFDGIEGRMKYTKLEGRTLLDNSCSGLSPSGLTRALEAGSRHPGKKLLVVGEESYNVCSGLDPAAALSLAANAGVDGIVTVGKRFDGVKCLDDGLNAALRQTSPGDIIISCVKTWR